MGGCQSLHQSVRQGSPATVRSTCARARNVNIREDTEGLQKWTALQLAAWLGKAEAVGILAEFGADINLTDANGATALHLAATQGHVATALALLDVGAQVNAFDRNRMTALHCASMDGHGEVVKTLCRHSADVNLPDYQGATPLHLASSEGHLQVVYILLDNGASALTVDYNGNTPLHDAAAGGHQIIMHRLMRHGAQIGLKNQNNLTAEQLYESTLNQQTMPIDVEDSQSATNMSETMPATPPRLNPSYSFSSSVDACPASGSMQDDLSEDEVTSRWVGNHAGMYNNLLFRPFRLGLIPSPTEVDQEPQPPATDVPFNSPEQPSDV